MDTRSCVAIVSTSTLTVAIEWQLKVSPNGESSNCSTVRTEEPGSRAEASRLWSRAPADRREDSTCYISELVGGRAARRSAARILGKVATSERMLCCFLHVFTRKTDLCRDESLGAHSRRDLYHLKSRRLRATISMVYTAAIRITNSAWLDRSHSGRYEPHLPPRLERIHATLCARRGINPRPAQEWRLQDPDSTDYSRSGRIPR